MTQTLAVATVLGTGATIAGAMWPSLWVGVIFSVLFVALEFLIIYLNLPLAMRLIKSALKKIIGELQRRDFKPDLIMSFNRSGAIAAGMLAGNLAIDNLIVVTRQRLEGTGRQLTRLFEVPDIFDIDALNLSEKNILVVFMVITTGETYDAATRFLLEHGAEPENIAVATILIKPELAKKRSDIIFGYERANPSQFIETAPWIFSPYMHR
jgi:hypoxanthine phosphoribosyltransferase